MEAHPVPQNVTTFQFRLVGDMTLKQFIYLAVGAGTAYLFFIFLIAPAPLLAWPLIIISALLGVAFAFLPIADRPLDHWSAAFIKAVYSPTKRSWSKLGKNYREDPLFQNRLNIYLSTLNSLTLPPIRQMPVPPSSPLPQPHPPMQQPTPIIPKEPLPSQEDLTKTVKLAYQAQALQVKMIAAERELSQIKASAGKGGDTTDYTKQFNEVFENLQRLTQEASAIKQQLTTITKQPTEPPKVKVEVVKPNPAKPTQPALTTFPNVINGVVIDPQNNYLEGVVVVIHDKDGLPVRALKTNKLGQFTGSTPLPNGTYTVEVEKEGFVFDILKLELEGKVLPPLNIAAKQAAVS